jgi:hypothetical protein
MTDPSNLYPPTPPTAPLPAPVGQWAVPAGSADGPGAGGDAGGGAAPSSGPNRRTGRTVAAVGVAVALLGGATFATAQLLSDESGAASPEEAAEQLIGAFNRADVIGLIELLPPGEREALLDITGELTDQGERLGLVDDAFRLDGIPGVTIEITDPELEVEELGEGLARVSVVDGEARVAIDGDVLGDTVGQVTEDLAEANDGEVEVESDEETVDIGELVEEAEDDADDRGGDVQNPFSVAVIEIDGRWHPSLGFTIAELARTDANRFEADEVGAPDLGDGVEPDGASSPEDVVQALLDAAVDLDPEAALAVLDPGEMAAAQVYADLFLGDVEGRSDEVDIRAELTDAEVTALGDGVNRVVPTGFVVEGTTDEETFRVELADGCVAIVSESDDPDVEDIDTEVCSSDDLTEVVPGELGEDFEDLEVPEELADLLDAFQPVEVGLVTVERDGEHFLSPLRTVFDVAAVAFRGLERSDLEEGGIVFDLLTGELDDEFDDFFDELSTILDEELEGTLDGDESVTVEDDFDDPDLEDLPLRVPTGATGGGPAGELVAGDVLQGSFPLGGVQAFTLIGTAGEAFVGAQTTNDADLTITVTDPVTGEELAFSDDFAGFDPETFLRLEEGQVVTVTVGSFADAEAGEFVIYYER